MKILSGCSTFLSFIILSANFHSVNGASVNSTLNGTELKSLYTETLRFYDANNIIENVYFPENSLIEVVEESQQSKYQELHALYFLNAKTNKCIFDGLQISFRKKVDSDTASWNSRAIYFTRGAITNFASFKNIKIDAYTDGTENGRHFGLLNYGDIKEANFNGAKIISNSDNTYENKSIGNEGGIIESSSFSNLEINAQNKCNSINNKSAIRAYAVFSSAGGPNSNNVRSGSIKNSSFVSNLYNIYAENSGESEARAFGFVCESIHADKTSIIENCVFDSSTYNIVAKNSSVNGTATAYGILVWENAKISNSSFKNMKIGAYSIADNSAAHILYLQGNAKISNLDFRGTLVSDKLNQETGTWEDYRLFSEKDIGASGALEIAAKNIILGNGNVFNAQLDSEDDRLSIDAYDKNEMLGENISGAIIDSDFAFNGGYLDIMNKRNNIDGATLAVNGVLAINGGILSVYLSEDFDYSLCNELSVIQAENISTVHFDDVNIYSSVGTEIDASKWELVVKNNSVIISFIPEAMNYALLLGICCLFFVIVLRIYCYRNCCGESGKTTTTY